MGSHPRRKVSRVKNSPVTVEFGGGAAVNHRRETPMDDGNSMAPKMGVTPRERASSLSSHGNLVLVFTRKMVYPQKPLV